VNVGKRLLNLADSFAEHVSEKRVDTFTAQVYARLGLPAPGVAANGTGVAGTAGSGPSGGSLREGGDAGRGEVGGQEIPGPAPLPCRPDPVARP
jgi:hypothetical protein